MPDYFAHLTFGAEVLRRLPEPIALELNAQRTAFNVGCFGPDPLFFYRILAVNDVRVQGSVVHQEPVRRCAERLRQAIVQKLPLSRGYAAGFLCHFALDSACHGYIEARAAEGPVTHSAMEAEFDRMLKERAGLDPLHTTGLPEEQYPPELWAAAAAAYANVTPDQFRRGLKGFFRAGRLQTKAAGTRCRQLVDFLALHNGHCAKARGIVLGKGHDPACAESTAELFRRYQSALETTPGEIVSFFRAVESGQPFGPQYDLNFSGHPAGEELPVEEEAAAAG